MRQIRATYSLLSMVFFLSACGGGSGSDNEQPALEQLTIISMTPENNSSGNVSPGSIEIRLSRGMTKEELAATDIVVERKLSTLGAGNSNRRLLPVLWETIPITFQLSNDNENIVISLPSFYDRENNRYNTAYEYRVSWAGNNVLSFSTEENYLEEYVANQNNRIIGLERNEYTSGLRQFSRFNGPGMDGIWRTEDDFKALGVSLQYNDKKQVVLQRSCSTRVQSDGSTFSAGEVSDYTYDEITGHPASRTRTSFFLALGTECLEPGNQERLLGYSTYEFTDDLVWREVVWDEGQDRILKTADDVPYAIYITQYNELGYPLHSFSSVKRVSIEGDASQANTVWVWSYDSIGSKLLETKRYTGEENLDASTGVKAFVNLADAIAATRHDYVYRRAYLGMNLSEYQRFQVIDEQSNAELLESREIYTYDTFGRMETLTISEGDEEIESYRIRYDDNGRREFVELLRNTDSGALTISRRFNHFISFPEK